ncbi:DUF3325 family protein [Chitinasiproducens palmae]|uniref:DUF3325 domain-containing protein n=1 Tax=Chitinasiproducens palmae TaxID=1770053 RepID=A0A1H2PJL9_9BURK|nr:DUF3325 family protein [Chitinasiproducens palmae]SDV46100.1 Protein of unknown function [Chitinasiproducens palmae]
MTTLAWALAIWLSLAGFATLSAAMYRHQQTILRREVGRGATLSLRLGGALLLAAAAAPCVALLGGPVGTVGWCGALTAGAAAVAAMHTYAPRAARWSAATGPVALLAALLAVYIA